MRRSRSIVLEDLSDQKVCPSCKETIDRVFFGQNWGLPGVQDREPEMPQVCRAWLCQIETPGGPLPGVRRKNIAYFENVFDTCSRCVTFANAMGPGRARKTRTDDSEVAGPCFYKPKVEYGHPQAPALAGQM